MATSNGMFSSAGGMPYAIADGSMPASYNQRTAPETNSLYDFLGTPQRHSPTDGYSYRARTNKTLVDAYIGRNAFVSDTVSFSLKTTGRRKKWCEIFQRLIVKPSHTTLLSSSRLKVSFWGKP